MNCRQVIWITISTGDAQAPEDVLKKLDTEVWRHKVLFGPFKISSYQASFLIILCPVAAQLL